MIESISERQVIASQVRQMRALEKSKNYRENDWDRDMINYLYWFNGLTNLFKYVRELNRGKLIFDLGAGTTKGISEIAKSRLGEGLSFEASVLTYRPEIKENLGIENTHITSAETLKGLKDNSVSAILALNSLAYSGAPHIAIKRIDEVLVPGGVIKATFKVKEKAKDQFATEYNYQTHDDFSTCLQELNYDVMVSDLASEELILAIKPGGNRKVLAQDLLRRDSGVIDIGMRLDGHY